MKYSLTLLTLAAFASSVPFASAAELSGKITLKGSPPAEKTIDMSSDPFCGKAHPKPVTTRHYVVGQDNGLANVIVFLKDAPKKDHPKPTDAPMLDQVDCVYEPYVLGARANQPIKIKNSDATFHNVHATPKLNKSFNFGQPVKGQVNEKTFPTPEVAIRFKCDVHPWMFAYVSVFDHPYFAVTDKDGNFTIRDVPPGEYTVEAFHQKTHVAKGTGATQKVKVEGDKATVNFEIEPQS